MSEQLRDHTLGPIVNIPEFLLYVGCTALGMVLVILAVLWLAGRNA